MRRVIVKALEGLLNAYYALCCLQKRRNVVLFLSRQSDSVSDDFRLIADEFKGFGGWVPVFRVKMLRGGVLGKLSYAACALGDVRMLARCKICFLEGYSPVVSMIRLKGDELEGETVNHLAPTEPVVMQLWHAAGAFKKFGYQVLDAPGGRSAEYARMLHMHRNYSWIIVSGQGAIAGFAEAMGYPKSRVVALGRASLDLLRQPDDSVREKVRAAYPQLVDSGKPVVVFAPTLSRADSFSPLRSLRDELSHDERSCAFEFFWSDHPVESAEAGSIPAVSTRDMLRVADLVVTDCSSIVFEAHVAGVPFAFYMPDSSQAQACSTLMVNPKERCPQLCFGSRDGLFEFLESVFEGHASAVSYPWGQNDDFIGDALTAACPGAAGRIARFALEQVEGIGTRQGEPSGKGVARG